MHDLRDDLREALASKGWTNAQLLKESGLKCGLSSLNRKLRGKQVLLGHEATAIAKALGVSERRIDQARALAMSGAKVSWAADKRES